MILVFWVAVACFTLSADPIEDWGRFEKDVRNQSVGKTEAKKAFPSLLQSLLSRSAEFSFSKAQQWVFPLEEYSIKDAGKGGFRPDIRYGSSPIKGYDFYDGNRHGGHPAYDIFIHDKDRDCNDDRTKNPVNVIAPVDLLILSRFTKWKRGSHLRGGNYVWALHAPEKMLFYFAHLDSIAVQPGNFVKAGSVVGTVGRTGKNAFPARCPTHLHLMVLKVKAEDLVPFDFWEEIGP